MTYSHDIFLDMDFDPDAFAAAVSDVRTLFRRTELPVVGPSGRPGTVPVLDDDFIGFNGINHDCTCDPEASNYRDMGPCWDARCRPASPRNDGGSPFVMDLKPERPWGVTTFGGRYWFECPTRRTAYDLAVMLAMVPLKHHLAEQIEIHTKGVWSFWNISDNLLFPWGPGWSKSSSVVSMYEQVFPERAPVPEHPNLRGRRGWVSYMGMAAG